MRKFKRAQAQNQAAIRKHLEIKHVESSSSEEENETLETNVEKVLSNYQSEGGDINKTLTYLTEIFQSGGAVCLICISSVKKTDPIWSCSKCYTFMHLPCIQHWVRDSLKYKHEKGIAPIWGCPKCRAEYEENQIPKQYKCFCGKTEDPSYQPWLIPHSCGSICEKFLLPKCGHKCVLLCHPGPCAPCPKMVLASCFCGKQVPYSRRCIAKEWSCDEICNKKYETCEHHCREKCHEENGCPPCSEKVLTFCNCKSKSQLRSCNESSWRCDKVCGRKFTCNIHVCEQVCHKVGDCNKCPLEENRTCPCGKKKYALSCKEQQVPTCGDTCGKILDCGAHNCNMRCHTEQCGKCLEVVTKTCRCGSFSKELPCVKDFHCNKKCPQMRLCGKHLCNKKCCNCLIANNYNQCEKVCDNTLNCRKHKCPAPCGHASLCYPCPRTNVIQCRCGNSKITVPCGTVKKIKPPNCNKKCKLPSICHHPKQDTHKCHYDNCPPCRKVCGLIYKRCGHECVALCHTNVWSNVTPSRNSKPIGPWDFEEEKWEFKKFPCPPCEYSVLVTCLGGHETLPWPCHKAIPSSCLRECGQLLACTNHYCEKLCHKLQLSNDGTQDESSDQEEKKCMECEKPCLFPRPKGCTHTCPKPCHPSPCDPCKQLIKVSCHCGINTLYIRCVQLNSASGKEYDELLKCGNQCPKNYPCGHRCIDDCHSGPCQKVELCEQKVRVFCKCKRIKKNFSCLLVRSEKAIINCDEVCQKKKEELNKMKEVELEKKKKEEELKNKKEIEAFEKKFKPKKRKNRNLNIEESNTGNSYKWIWVIAILFGGISAIVIFTFQTKNA